METLRGGSDDDDDEARLLLSPLSRERERESGFFFFFLERERRSYRDAARTTGEKSFACINPATCYVNIRPFSF